jgi:hypothetical protein
MILAQTLLVAFVAKLLQVMMYTFNEFSCYLPDGTEEAGITIQWRHSTVRDSNWRPPEFESDTPSFV